MMESRLRPWLALVAALALTSVAATVALVGRRRGQGLSPDGVVDSGGRPRPGSPADRGTGRRYAVDVDRLRQQRDHEPAVEYLTYIQSRRGSDHEHLLFVRHEDLDQIAALEGEDPERFLRRLQRLGVVISVN